VAIGAAGGIADIVGLTIMIVVGGSFALEAGAPAAGGVAALAPEQVEAAVASGRAVLVVLRGGAGALGTTTQGSLSAGFVASAKAAGALAAGTVLFVGIPEARADDPKKPAKMQASPADLVVQKLRSPLPLIGSIARHQSADWRVAGFASNQQVLEPIVGKKNGP
jgi:hypothetical protein